MKICFPGAPPSSGAATLRVRSLHEYLALWARVPCCARGRERSEKELRFNVLTFQRFNDL
jgi:hypothetical protein